MAARRTDSGRFLRREKVIAQPLEIAFEHFHAGRLGAAEAICRETLGGQPEQPDCIHLLGAIASRVGQQELALDLLRRAIALKPRAEHYRNSLGLALQAHGELEAAVAAYLTAIGLSPNFPEAHYNMGNALLELSRFEEAAAAYRTAINIRPHYPDAHNNLGNSLKEQGRLQEALAAYRLVVTLDPDLSIGHNNLGIVLKELGRTDQAVSAFHRALELAPDDAEAHNNLGNVLKDEGIVDEAIACYRRATALSPHDAELHSNLVFSLQFDVACSAPSLEEECARWNRFHAAPLRTSRLPHLAERKVDRRLKVGYVSPDFNRHPVSFFALPLLEAHDRAKFQVFCYSSVRRRDELTERFRKVADQWRDVLSLSDEELARLIRSDGIDILVDLTMHSARNRLLTFARKPAPVQVSWLAYPGSTGMEAIDYRLIDPMMEPPQVTNYLSPEQSIRLPDSWCCYEPVGEFPEVGLLPALQRGAITFGSLNNLCKVNDGVLVCWMRVLQAVEGSRLLMFCPTGRGRKRILEIFEAHGVTLDRVEFEERLGWSEYLRLFHRIDIALDPFPVNGMTTTCNALWMGAPVITLPGSTPASRAGFSLLSIVGLAELAAESEESYVRIASDLAHDLPRLSELRGTMRCRMQGSALMDAPRFAGNVENAYREMWRRWCEGGEVTG